MPHISIIIPVYNGADYLCEAIDSALGQDYPNREIIVVNDGSDDGGAVESICQSYGNSIRYVAKENGGVGSALNAGIEAMRGEYFSWLSHDDIYEPHKLSTQVRRLGELGGRDAVLYSNFLHVDTDNNPLFEVRLDHELLRKKPLYSLFLGGLNGCTMLIPRRAFDEVGLFKNLPTTQDYEMWGRLIRRYSFIHMPEMLLRSRLHPRQCSRCLAAEKEADAFWIDLMNSLTPEKLASLEASEALFYYRMAQKFEQTPYSQALGYARSRCSGLTLAERARLWSIRAFIRRSIAGLGLLPWAQGLNVFLKGGGNMDSFRSGLRLVAFVRRSRSESSAISSFVDPGRAPVKRK